jgi:hypothetical protein
VAQAIAAQLRMHRDVLHWYFYQGGSPFKASKYIGIGPVTTVWPTCTAAR